MNAKTAMSGELVPLRAEALVRLEEAGALSGIGLDLSVRPGLTYEQYASIGALLGRATTALRFAAGDWLVFGEEVFGERAADTSELLGMSPEGRMELARVARAIPRSRRRAGLSWGHHRLLAARWIEPQTREELLDEAQRSGWSVRELEAVVRERRALEAGLHVEDVNGCEDLAESAARDLREQLILCGFERDITASIEIAAPGISYTTTAGAA